MQTLWPHPDELEIATPHQRERYAMATRGPVGVLGGNPGAGKTFLTAQIVKACMRRFGDSEVAVSAPTGMAAQRVTCAMLNNHVNHEATTHHRRLGVQRNGHDGKGWGFQHNERFPFKFKFLFGDESSMNDTPITSNIVRACPPGMHIIWIGDFAQLPPVGHGAPLRDMIAAGLPYGELTEIHRNEGAIVRACRELKERRRFEPSKHLDVPAGENLWHIECRRSSQVFGALAHLLRSVPPGVDPKWDVQVIVPRKKDSELAVSAVNSIVQKILNPDGQQVDGNRFRVGDKVICLSNGMLPLLECPNVGLCDAPSADVYWHDGRLNCANCGHAWKPNQSMPDFVANGEIGCVLWVGKGMMHVRFGFPARSIRFAGPFMDNVDLAYGVTGHKGQGNQWKVPIVLADDSNGADRVTSWEWWRTALSRGEKMCVTIGKKAAIDRQCRRSALAERKTFLAQMLQEPAMAA